jgi:hypothetical protein
MAAIPAPAGPAAAGQLVPVIWASISKTGPVTRASVEVWFVNKSGAGTYDVILLQTWTPLTSCPLQPSAAPMARKPSARAISRRIIGTHSAAGEPVLSWS